MSLPRSARALTEAAATGEISPLDIVEGVLARIEASDGEIGAFLEVRAEEARAHARRLEASKDRGPLFGVPFAIKDNLQLAGWPITCASRILEGHRAAYSATAVQRLVDAGAIPIGRCNMDEFGFGSSTEHSAFGITRNPWNTDRIPGGSSGGSAAAVASGMVPLALGTDTGGSIRQPAALCGVTGLKPTYGRVSRFGLIAFGSSLDQIGPIARSAEDCALALSVIAGHDPLFSTSLSEIFATSDRDLAGLRVGVAELPASASPAASIQARVAEAIDTMSSLGAEVRPVALPHAEHAIAAYYLVATSEASSNLSRFDGIRYGNRVPATDLRTHYIETRSAGFGEEAKRRILLGGFALSSGYYDAYYKKALQVRTLIRRDFEAAFADVDVIVGPTTPLAAFTIGDSIDDPLSLWLCDLLTTPANLAGIPAVSIPCGFDDDGMPVGLQLQGPALGDAKLLAAATTFQRATTFHDQRPGAS